MKNSVDSEEDLQEKFWEIQANFKSIMTKILLSLFAIIGSTYYIGWKSGAVLTSCLIGYKLARMQGYSFRNWELYATALLWPVIVVVDLIFKGVEKND
mgnify:CR=1 FL=1